MPTCRSALLCTMLLLFIVPATAGAAAVVPSGRDRAGAITGGRVPLSLPGGTMPSPAFERASRILLLGGMAGFFCWQTENPERAATMLETGPIEAPIDLSDAYANGMVLGGVALGGLAVGRLAHAPRLQAFGSDLTYSLLGASAAVWGLKLGINRTRPNGGRYSFPSGHTAVAFCAAPIVMKHFGWKAGVPAYALAVGAGLGRMEDRKHFLSDVVVGAAIGLAVGDAVAHHGLARDLSDRVVFDRNAVGLRFTF